MKKFLLTTVIAGIIMAGLPATSALATPTNPAPGERWAFSFNGTVPCTVVCSYWEAGNAGYKPCENPFPPQSFVDVITRPAPTPPAGKKMIIELSSSPVVDWDTWICGLLSSGSHNGGELAAGANILGQLCDNSLGADNPVPIGCVETADAPAEAGKQYVLRAYNWSDYTDDPAFYNWIMV